MSDATHYETAPEDRIPFPKKLIYGLGAFVNNTLAAAIGGMIIVLNLGYGMNPALVGLLGALPRLTDAITDPLMGYISDNTKSRWGRRRPYIFVGAIAVGIIYALLWQLPADKSDSFYFWYFLSGSLIFYLGYTIYATPWVALGYELTPDYHERTRLMGVQNFIGNIAYMISPYFLAIMFSERLFTDVKDGASNLAIMIGVVVILVGVMPAIFLRERFKEVAAAEVDAHKKETGVSGSAIVHLIKDFLHGFALTLKFKPFLKLCAATFLVFNGFILIASFQSYVIIYYVFGGDAAKGAELVGHSGLLMAVFALAVIAFVTWLATKIGKRRAFFVSTGISMVGYALKWFCYTPDNPWLVLIPAPLMAFGLAGLFTLMPSMICDVVDADELNTHERREGMYGSIFWWVVKLGQAVAIAGGGILLNLTGFDVALEGNQAPQTITYMRMFDAFVPCIASGVAIWAIATFSITEEKAYEVRLQLEARRGTA
ncbi:MAG: MFS transporter [Gammaproteobacteria bacterium]|nr:MFS transporter [Gammaproteobacteria bacterium]MDH3408311.1 MFS transporter [Gammaproteobacteria bacterium]MDH3553026.1 MFS transporter [Gammaproteobacteria bacterium]